MIASQRERTCECPAARTDEADKVRGFRLGAEDCVAKPFGILEQMALVEAVLRRGRLRLQPERVTNDNITLVRTK